MIDEELSGVTDESEQGSLRAAMPRGLYWRGRRSKKASFAFNRAEMAAVVVSIELRFDENPVEEVIWGHILRSSNNVLFDSIHSNPPRSRKEMTSAGR